MPAKSRDPIDAFLAHLTAQDPSPNTLRAYRQDLQHFAKWFTERNEQPFTLAQFTREDVRQYVRRLNDGDAAHATVHRRLASLRALTKWAQGTNALTTDPMRDIEGPEKQALAPKWLEKREWSALLREAEAAINSARSDTWRWLARRNNAVTVTMLETGLRISEVCALKLADVSLSERKGAVTVLHGKGNKVRVIPLNTDARAALGDWLTLRGTAGEILFVGKGGEPLEEGGVRKMLQELARRADIADFTPHTLRHTFAKRLIDDGVSLEKVAALLGHSSLDTTKIYLAPSLRDLENAVERR